MDDFRTIRFRREGEYYVAILGDMEATGKARTLPKAVKRMLIAEELQCGTYEVVHSGSWEVAKFGDFIMLIDPAAER